MDRDEEGGDKTEGTLPDVFSTTPDVLCQSIPYCNEGRSDTQANQEAGQRS